MAERKSFLLRIDRDTLDAVQRWANDDLRSLNGQIEFLLRRALQQNARASRGNTTNRIGMGDTEAAEPDQAKYNPADDATNDGTSSD